MKFNKTVITAFLVMSTLSFSLSVSSALAEDELTESTNSASTSIHERRVMVEQHIKELKMMASTTKERMKDRWDDGAMGSTTRDAMKAKIGSTTSERMELKCGALTERVDKRLSNFGTLFQSHVQNYETHLKTLKTIASKADAKGLDVTKFNADIAILEAKVAKLITDKESVKTSLSLTREYSCGDMSGEFKTAVLTLRDSQKIIAEDARDIFEFIKSTLKVDVMNLREEYNKEKSDSSSQ